MLCIVVPNVAAVPLEAILGAKRQFKNKPHHRRIEQFVLFAAWINLEVALFEERLETAVRQKVAFSTVLQLRFLRRFLFPPAACVVSSSSSVMLSKKAHHRGAGPRLGM
ncbi:hypothetical protein M514_01881 [Trichuris suis]|uniref:Uncharacterized protein n=1 Tax=Trichuris suis TaxID=68888 RepID=A0A085NTG3_9BILA|nr:hypothetical protein M513_01881 [Trichuris suis]KFD72759.1 hypothetical protein M514_01881 [Trichuris suis]